jgi:MFS family permease
VLRRGQDGRGPPAFPFRYVRLCRRTSLHDPGLGGVTTYHRKYTIVFASPLQAWVWCNPVFIELLFNGTNLLLRLNPFNERNSLLHSRMAHGEVRLAASEELHVSSDSSTLREAIRHRTRSLVASIGVMLTCGGIYLFPAYSNALAERLALSNTELEIVAATGIMGECVAVVPGLICDRVGPRRSLLIGAAVQVVGQVAMGLAYDGVLPGHVAWLAIYNFILAQGCATAYIAVMKTTQTNYNREERGRFVGLMAGFFGMSSGAFSLTYKTLFEPYSDQLSRFFYAVAAFTFAVQLLCTKSIATLPGTCAPPRIHAPERLRNTMVYAVTGTCLVLQVGVGLLHVLVDNQPVLLGTYCVYAAGLLAYPTLLLGVWPRWGRLDGVEMAAGLHLAVTSPTTVESPLETVDNRPRGSSSRRSTAAGACAADDPQAGVELHTEPALRADTLDDKAVVSTVAEGTIASPPLEEGVDVLPAMRTLDFWLLFAALGGGLTLSLTILDNLAGITASFSSEFATSGEVWEASDGKHDRLEHTIGALVVFYSCCNVAGRLAIGFIADRLRDRVTRVAWVALGCMLAVAASVILLAAPTTAALFVAVPLGGLSMGVLFGTAPLSTTEMFGLRRYPSIWGILTFGPSIGAVVVGTVIAGLTSDNATDDEYFVVKGHRSCHGVACYQTPLIVSLAVSLAALMCASVLARRRQTAKRIAQLLAESDLLLPVD